MLRAITIAIAGLVAGVPAIGEASASPVLLISLDGLRPDDVREAKARGLNMPVLSGLAEHGASARGVTGVLPTLTYPSHTTLITGVSPAKHGISNNLTFDPDAKNQTGWYWYASDVCVPTLWTAAHAKGLTTANVHWPVSVGARDVDANLPQIWRTGTADDAKLLAALATPGLLADLQRRVGEPYAQGIDESVEGDANRVRFAAAILATRKPAFMTVYLAGIDHEEHGSGPGSAAANAAIERTDSLVGQLVSAARAAMPDVTIVLVSDHGFQSVATDINLFKPFIDAGLITLGPDGKPTAWQAMPWLAGGTAAIRLARPDDATLVEKVRGVLGTMATDPAYHITQVLDRSAIARAGGASEASFFIALQPGFETGRDPAAPVSKPSTYKGMHGYLPSDPAMRSTLIVAGPGIAHRDLGIVDMRAVAPSIARVLGVQLPDGEVGPVF
ncbi:nucleotide pyrophosphatase [Sphingomonas sp. Leaf357]|uniref:alkaline phosphatase family protein n=1 Tax=Sphingomonas sp. Leaf357 TaxID=1736350 RepID=UPI0006F5CAF3|nr:ectonucleotide pyrophosphatase/phosphodiesterase [Sphingomonas sp. Leaf357]KQS04114.1 nucleotide pyrophosphatase [Sphingomonas sp. Leaf357]